MQATWILVANACQAKILQNHKRYGELEVVKEFTHPESRTKGSELASDRPGHNQSKGNGHGSLVEQSDPKSYEAIRFAKELAEALESGRTGNCYGRVVVVAPPQFLGQLNTHLNDRVRRLISSNLQKDYTKLDTKALLPALKEQEAL